MFLFPWAKKDAPKSGMAVVVDRDSVCMGDDCVSHKKTYYMSDSATYEDLFHVLQQDHYFSGLYENAVWVLTNETHFCIFSWFAKTDRFYAGLAEKSLKKLCGESPRVRLKYYRSPQEWKKRIEQEYRGDGYSMWRDGWDKEIAHCDELM